MTIWNEMMKGTCMGVPGCAVEEGRSEELWVARRYASVREQIRPQAAHVSTLLYGSIEKREEKKKKGGVRVSTTNVKI